MKTKPFLLATAGSTVDGRVIDDKMIAEMASSYDPKTYGARLNIEHIRGISGDGPFRAYGDVLELSTAEVEVNFNGAKEKRLGLYGVLDVTSDAKKLNEAGQKVFSSIEIEPNFGGKGFAYLMGCAMTDSPAAIATDRLQFNRAMPGTLTLSRDESALFELADETGAEGGGFLSALTGVLDKFAANFAPKPPAQQQVQPAGTEPAPGQAFDFNLMRPMFEDLGKAFATSIDGLRTEVRGELDTLGVKLKKIETEQEEAPAPNFRARPQGDGKAGNYKGIF